jgi:hypothetical protein
MRRGNADVIVVVLLILISLAAAMILWGIINTQVSKNSLKIENSAECLDEKFNPQIVINNACFVGGSNEIEMQIFRRFKNEEIKEINIYFSGQDTNAKFLAGGDCESCKIPMPGESVIYRFNPYTNENFEEANLIYKTDNCQIMIPYIFLRDC